MATTLTAKVLADELAVSLAQAVAVANERARLEGVEIKQTMVTISEQVIQGGLCWRVNYGPRDYVGRRGGDLIVEVGRDDAQVKRVLRSQ